MASAIGRQFERHAGALAIEEWGAEALPPIGPHLSVLLPLEPAVNGQRRWYAVRTQAQQESNVAALLREARMDAYDPRQFKSVRVGSIESLVTSPLIAEYIFAGFDLYLDRWEIIHDICGVVKVLTVNNRPVPIADADICDIRRREAELSLRKSLERSPTTLKRGDLVQLGAGAWAGFFGRVLELLTDKGRVKVTIDVFGRQTPVELSGNQVRAI